MPRGATTAGLFVLSALCSNYARTASAARQTISDTSLLSTGHEGADENLADALDAVGAGSLTEESVGMDADLYALSGMITGMGVGFDSAEHKALGDEAFEQFKEQMIRRSAELLGDDHHDHFEVERLLDTFISRPDRADKSERGDLSYGDLVFLSGDYFADLEQNEDGTQKNMEVGGLDDMHQTFDRYIVSRMGDITVWGLIKYIEDLMNSMKEATKPEDLKGGFVSWGKRQAKLIAFRGKAYWHLAKANWNHFGRTAEKEYRTGHALALRYAAKAGEAYANRHAEPPCESTVLDYSCNLMECPLYTKASCMVTNSTQQSTCTCTGKAQGVKACAVGAQCKRNPKSWAGLMRRAIELEGFSAHFLSDLFSGGHCRVPYFGSKTSLAQVCPGHFEKMKNHVPFAGYMTKQQHDEDSWLGVAVENSKGKKWIAYGDGMNFLTSNTKNRRHATEAMAAGLHSVFATFVKAGHADFDAAALVDLDPLEWVGRPRDDSFPPLFMEEDGSLYGRISALPADLNKTVKARYLKVAMKCDNDWTTHTTQWFAVAQRLFAPKEGESEMDDDHTCIPCGLMRIVAELAANQAHLLSSISKKDRKAIIHGSRFWWTCKVPDAYKCGSFCCCNEGLNYSEALQACVAPDGSD